MSNKEIINTHYYSDKLIKINKRNIKVQTYITKEQVRYHEQQIKIEERRVQRIKRAKAAFEKYLDLYDCGLSSSTEGQENYERITQEYMAEWLSTYDSTYHFSDDHSVWMRGERMSKLIDHFSKSGGVPQEAISAWRNKDCGDWIEFVRKENKGDLSYKRLYEMYVAGITDLHVQQVKDYIQAIDNMAKFAVSLPRSNRVWTKRTPRTFLLDNGERIPCYARKIPRNEVPNLVNILQNTEKLTNSALCKDSYFLEFYIPDPKTNQGYRVVETGATYQMDKWDNKVFTIGNVHFIIEPDNKHFERSKPQSHKNDSHNSRRSPRKFNETRN